MLTKTSQNAVKHALHISEGLTYGPIQAHYWIPAFIISQQSFIVLTRYEAIYNYLKQYYPNINIIYARTASEIEQILTTLPQLQAIYYFSNTANTIHTLRYNQYKHIFLRNIATDKQATPHKYFRVYDEIWADNQDYLDRFQSAGFQLRHLKLHCVGKPSWIELPSTEKDYLDLPSILYLPNWEGEEEVQNLSSIHLSTLLLSYICSRSSPLLHLHLHPMLGRRNKLLTPTSNYVNSIKKLCSNLKNSVNTLEVLNAIRTASFIVCDLSSYYINYIAVINKPIFIYVPNDRKTPINFSQELQSIPYTSMGYVYSTVEEFKQLYKQVILKKNDWLINTRKQAICALLEKNNPNKFSIYLKNEHYIY